jgi:tetratricopeptide (TPR) repeat protein
LRLRPNWEAVALFKGKVLQAKGEPAVLDYWRGYLEQHPGAREVRMAYAQMLARADRLAEARNEFQTLLRDAPDNPDVHAAVGLLAMQMNDLDAAEANLKLAIEHGHGEPDTVRMYLGQLDEGRRRYEDALVWYRAIQDGKQVFEARMREAQVLAKLGRSEQALQLLRAQEAGDEAERVMLIQNEAQVLREAGDHAGAYAALDRGLVQLPDNPELLYDRAMAAEKVDRLDQVEKDLRKLIELRPEHAHAYNALGYTLADRTGRIDEAIALLGKALALAPEDPFILDSMGWALYKARRLEESVGYLRRALKGRDDPEIAAHLGEVLWQLGERDEARRIWQGSLKSHPDNERLRETLSRFQP